MDQEIATNLVAGADAPAPGVAADAPQAAVPAAELPKLDHAAFFESLTSWLAGRALTFSSVCSTRSRGALRKA